MEENVVTTEKKNFTTMDKSMLLAAAKSIVRHCCLKKDKYVLERDKIRDNFEKTLEEEIQKRIAKMREDGKARLEKRLSNLNKQIEDMDNTEKDWERNIIEKTGYRLRDIFNYGYVKGEGNNNRLEVNFKYPETIVPNESVCVNGVICDEEGEPIDEHNAELAEQYPYDHQPECPSHEYGSDFDEDREADIDEDMPGEFEEVPEYDSAGFSTADGLAEGEPAELAEKVDDPDREEIADNDESDDDPFFIDTPLM